MRDFFSILVLKNHLKNMSTLSLMFKQKGKVPSLALSALSPEKIIVVSVKYFFLDSLYLE